MSPAKFVYLFFYFQFGLIGADGIGTFKTIPLWPKQFWNDTHVDLLKKDLLQNYDRYLRPEHSHEVTRLKISLTILHLETDEAKSVITVDSWLALEWTDSKLKWNEKDYGGMTKITISDHEVWQPDMYLYNSVGGGEQLSGTGIRNVIVYSEGRVFWVPPIKFTALCDFNMKYWPFDKQYCFLKIGSWTYSSLDIKMENSTRVEVEDTAVASLWDIEVKAEIVEKKYDCCPETYESINYQLNITRKSTPYAAIVVTPAVVSTFLLLIQFWLPPYAEEKIIINICCALMLNLFLLYFNHQTYTAGNQTPLIVKFYGFSLYIVGFTTLSSVFTYWISNWQNSKPLSSCFKKLLSGLTKWLLVEQYPCGSTYVERGQLEDDEEVDKKRALANLVRAEWTTVAVCVDRLIFVICTFTFVVFAICLS